MSSDFFHLVFQCSQGRHIKSLTHERVANLYDAVSNLSSILEDDYINRSLFRR
jgi:hypothetical protein